MIFKELVSYVPTPEADNIFPSTRSTSILISISALPFYQEKSHEEMRAEDYQLTGRTGSCIINTNSKSSNQHNTKADNVSVFAPFTNSDQERSGWQGTKWSYETSPFGNESPSYSSSSSTFGTISSGFRIFTTGPFKRSLVQENTSANNVSVFAPFTRSNLGISDIQGTRICSYAPTPEADNIFPSTGPTGILISISAMHFYLEKSHEELRLEDYQLTGRTGSSIINTNSKSSNQHNTSANNVSVFTPMFVPFTNSDPGRSGCQGTKWSHETSRVEGNNIPVSNAIFSKSTMPFNKEKGHEEVRSSVDYQFTGKTGEYVSGAESSSIRLVSQLSMYQFLYRQASSQVPVHQLQALLVVSVFRIHQSQSHILLLYQLRPSHFIFRLFQFPCQLK